MSTRELTSSSAGHRSFVLWIVAIVPVVCGVVGAYTWGTWLHLQPTLITDTVLLPLSNEVPPDMILGEWSSNSRQGEELLERREGCLKTSFHSFYFTQKRRIGPDQKPWIVPDSVICVANERAIAVVTGMSALAFAWLHGLAVILLLRRRIHGASPVGGMLPEK